MNHRGKKTISFVLESEEEKQRLDQYAKGKGFTGAASLARFALYQYISRYPVKDPMHVQPEPSEGNTEGGPG